LYPEYTGTIARDLPPDLQLNSIPQMRAALAQLGLGMTEPLGFNNTYVLGMRRSNAAVHGIRTISDLRFHPTVHFGFSHEFLDRKDGWRGVARTYGLAVLRSITSPDQLGRADVRWTAMCLRIPDDGAEALPLLRGIIANDDKSSTYKLGLLGRWHASPMLLPLSLCRV